MSKQAGPSTSETPATSALARAIRRFAQTDGDHNTAIPALTLHRRRAPTEPLHCIYNLGLGVVAQGDKQVLLGGESIDYGPGQSMLTTIDLPVVSHVTRASVRGTVSRHDADAGRPLDRADRVRDGCAPVSARRRLSVHLVRSTRRRLARCPGPARQAAGRAGTGSPAGASDSAGNHRPPADRSARPATPAPRHRRIPEPADCEGGRLAQAELRRRRCRGTTWRIART